MGTITALLLAASGPAIAPAVGQGVQISAQATATVEIIRAARASAAVGPGEVQRRVRSLAGGGVVIEFN